MHRQHRWQGATAPASTLRVLCVLLGCLRDIQSTLALTETHTGSRTGHAGQDRTEQGVDHNRTGQDRSEQGRQGAGKGKIGGPRQSLTRAESCLEVEDMTCAVWSTCGLSLRVGGVEAATRAS